MHLLTKPLTNRLLRAAHARIERVAQTITEEGKSKHDDGDGYCGCKQDEGLGVDGALPIQHQRAPTGDEVIALELVGRAQAQAKIAKDRFRDDQAGHGECGAYDQRSE